MLLPEFIGGLLIGFGAGVLVTFVIFKLDSLYSEPKCSKCGKQLDYYINSDPSHPHICCECMGH